MTPDADRAWPAVRFDPEALALFCRRFGVAPADAAAMMDADNAEMGLAWRAYRARHPGRTLRDFVLEQLEETLVEPGLGVGLPPDAARRLARSERRRTEARS